MATDVMIDLETMSTAGNAAIVSLGAVVFDPTGSEEPDIKSERYTFYRNVDLESCTKMNLDVQGATVMWWLNQSEDARKSLSDPRPVPVTQALTDFASWYRGVTDSRSCVWSHGATFDIPIVANIYSLMGKPTPWKFWNARDTRTVFDITGYKLESADVRIGGHNSLNDAYHQAIGVQRALRGAGYVN